MANTDSVINLTKITRNYISSLQNDTGHMMWPANLTSSFDYVQIDVEEFKSVRKRQSSGSSFSSNASAFGSGGGTGISGSASYGNRFKSSVSTSTQVAGTVLLPMPDNIKYDDRPKWTDTEVGILGRFAPELAGALASGDDGEITKKVQTMADVGKVGLIKGLISKMGADPNAVTQNIGGKIVNPYVEQVFGGVDLRSFDFNWKLVPRNPSEQRAIQRIIKFLRIASMPDTSDSFGAQGIGVLDGLSDGPTATDRWLTVPKLFNLRWKVNNSMDLKSLPKIKKCVCKSISVEYTPDNVWATHLVDRNDPAPVAYNLTASFGESEIITSTDVKRGY